MRIPIRYIETYKPERSRPGTTEIAAALRKIAAIKGHQEVQRMIGGNKVWEEDYKTLVYGDSPEKEIDVVFWCRWPAYDMIFGVPAKTNRKYKTEGGFFHFRDIRRRKVACGFYVAINELEILVEGFKLTLKRAKNKSGRIKGLAATRMRAALA